MSAVAYLLTRLSRLSSTVGAQKAGYELRTIDEPYVGEIRQAGCQVALLMDASLLQGPRRAQFHSTWAILAGP